MVRLVDPEGHHAHVLVPQDQLSLAIGREGQNVRLAARLTGWKIDIKNAQEYDQASEDQTVSGLIAQRQEEEALQAEAESRLQAEQATRAEEDARLRELYPLPEDEEENELALDQGDSAEASADQADEASADHDAADEDGAPPTSEADASDADTGEADLDGADEPDLETAR
jgi:N utilization substance protein A